MCSSVRSIQSNIKAGREVQCRRIKRGLSLALPLPLFVFQSWYQSPGKFDINLVQSVRSWASVTWDASGRSNPAFIFSASKPLILPFSFVFLPSLPSRHLRILGVFHPNYTRGITSPQPSPSAYPGPLRPRSHLVRRHGLWMRLSFRVKREVSSVIFIGYVRWALGLE